MACYDRALRVLPMISVMGSIFLLSHQPGTTLQFVVPPGAVPPQRALRTGILVVFICFLYGISDEVHQAFVPGREASVGDLLADVAGAAIVVALWLRRTVCRQPTTP